MRTRDSEKEELVKKEAVKMLVADGFGGFSMNRLAKNCGISVATLYIYYKDKDDMVKKIGVSIGHGFLGETLKNFHPDMPFKEGLRRQWENRMRYVLKYPMEMACYEIIRHSGHGEYIFTESMKDFKLAMHSFFQNAIQKKELISVTPEVFWAVAYGPLYTLLRFHNEGKSMGGKQFKFSKKMMEEAFDMVIKALTP